MNYIKNQNTLTRLFTFFAIIVFLVSCNEEKIIDSPENSLDVETSYISFDTKEDYANVVKNRSILSSKSTQSNFKSLKLAIEEFHTDPSVRYLV